ncbi:MAG: hypothetical protein IJA22_03825 [Clostridia bacterium]|nr:hypothetical protein [Clostridia bacterium]
MKKDKQIALLKRLIDLMLEESSIITQHGPEIKNLKALIDSADKLEKTEIEPKWLVEIFESYEKTQKDNPLAYYEPTNRILSKLHGINLNKYQIEQELQKLEEKEETETPKPSDPISSRINEAVNLTQEKQILVYKAYVQVLKNRLRVQYDWKVSELGEPSNVFSRTLEQGRKLEERNKGFEIELDRLKNLSSKNNALIHIEQMIEEAIAKEEKYDTTRSKTNLKDELYYMSRIGPSWFKNPKTQLLIELKESLLFEIKALNAFEDYNYDEKRSEEKIENCQKQIKSLQKKSHLSFLRDLTTKGREISAVKEDMSFYSGLKNKSIESKKNYLTSANKYKEKRMKISEEIKNLKSEEAQESTNPSAEKINQIIQSLEEELNVLIEKDIDFLKEILDLKYEYVAAIQQQEENSTGFDYATPVRESLKELAARKVFTSGQQHDIGYKIETFERLAKQNQEIIQEKERINSTLNNILGKPAEQKQQENKQEEKVGL